MSMALYQAPIIERLADTPISPSWAFSGAKRKDTTYITHGYHRYPAKFIPQLARRLIETYSQHYDTVLDPFCGCGTTLVESLVSRRYSYGYDINPISIMMTMVKTVPINPILLNDAYAQIHINYPSTKALAPKNERIDYWYRDKEKQQLAQLLQVIRRIDDADIRRFFLCGFSNILKNCSIWHQKSNKPTRDFKKRIPDVLRSFDRQIRMMRRGNADFWNLTGGDPLAANAECRDSRNLPLAPESVNLVVSSPPYVTSYEYGDLHQLSMLWLEGLDDLRAFREKFIGSALRRVDGDANYETLTRSYLAAEIGRRLERKSVKTAASVVSYFESMGEIWAELYRVLCRGGKACIVIGNTSLKGTEILNAEVFVEQMQALGFVLCEVIKREIPSKNLPSTRDKATGRFAKTADANAYAYPTEYVLVLEK